MSHKRSSFQSSKAKNGQRKQQEFKGKGFQRPGDCFGGALLKGNPKSRRPLESKLPIHLTLRATKSVLRIPKVFGKVHETIEAVARKHGVKIYKYANVGNHLHFAIKIPHVKRWAGFIRELTGRLALVCRAFLDGKSMWKFRPYTRIVRGWKKAFQIVKEYIYLNWCEAEGHIKRSETKRLKDFRALLDFG